MATVKYGKHTVENVQSITIFSNDKEICIRCHTDFSNYDINAKRPKRMKVECKSREIGFIDTHAPVIVNGDVMSVASSDYIYIDGFLSNAMKFMFRVVAMDRKEEFPYLKYKKINNDVRAQILHIDGDLVELDFKNALFRSDINVKCTVVKGIRSKAYVYVKGSVSRIVSAHTICLKERK